MVDRDQRRRSKAYSGMFSMLAFGTISLVCGLIGWEIGHQMFSSGRWADGIVWRQVAVGSVLLVIGLYRLWRLEGSRWTMTRGAPRRVVKHVGRGRSAGASADTDPARLPEPHR